MVANHGREMFIKSSAMLLHSIRMLLEAYKVSVGLFSTMIALVLISYGLRRKNSVAVSIGVLLITVEWEEDFKIIVGKNKEKEPPVLKAEE